LIVKPEGNGGSGWIVPEDAITLVCNYKRNTYTLPRGRVVVMSTMEYMIAMVEVAFLILTQAVIMLIRWRSEAGADLEEGCVSGAAVIEDIGVAVLMGVLMERPTPGVEPLKNFAMSALVPVGTHFGPWGETVTIRRLERKVSPEVSLPAVHPVGAGAATMP
jgi:hypothetical protein